MVETNINAYITELDNAKLTLAEAQAKVNDLTDYIASRGVVVEADVEEVVVAKKGKK
jgi:hypothetical protein